MPFNVPIPVQKTINKPFFDEVKRYLVLETEKGLHHKWPYDYLGALLPIANSSFIDFYTLLEVLRRLPVCERSDVPRHRDIIIAGLEQYLVTTDARGLYNGLVHIVSTTPLSRGVESLQAVLANASETARSDAYNGIELLYALQYSPAAVQLLLDYMPEDAKQRVFTRSHLNDVPMDIALKYNPQFVHPMLMVMPVELKREAFAKSGTRIITALINHNHIETLLALMSERVIPATRETVNVLVKNKKPLLDHIMSLDEPARLPLLGDIVDNRHGSLLGKVFHTRTTMLSVKSASLTRAEAEYQRLLQSPAAMSSPAATSGFVEPLPPVRFEERLRRIGFDGVVPPRFLCPITGQIMEDPVLLSDGHHYDKQAIETIFSVSDQVPRSPVTGEAVEPLYDADIKLSSAIEDFVLNQEIIYAEQELLLSSEMAEAASSTPDPVASNSVMDGQALYPTLARAENEPLPPVYSIAADQGFFKPSAPEEYVPLFWDRRELQPTPAASSSSHDAPPPYSHCSPD
ncbi:U-box domain-containing protein [Legionella sp. CNM-4043-24]|uniref:U-box domain-containing protein n=1 Tax=Legionella sp. CNM-4043-24 TaxID=3421646 RepID=UPI00403AE619